MTPTRPTERPTVLYVEDVAVNALVMAALFQRRPDLELLVATDGAQALRLAAGLRPALLLLDLCLPDCHGSGLLAQLRQLPGCATPAAIAVSSETDFVVEGSGFLEQWHKPLDFDAVLERLDELLPPPPSPQPWPQRLSAEAARMAGASLS
jgi:CheY-like chemotaxis protein